MGLNLEKLMLPLLCNAKHKQRTDRPPLRFYQALFWGRIELPLLWWAFVEPA